MPGHNSLKCSTSIAFSGGLLAGGKSSRMGRDKAFVEFKGQPLWQHQLATLREAGAAEILISGRANAGYAQGGFPVIEDEIKEAGPLAGVASLLAAAIHPLVLILAIDMPDMTADYLSELLRQCSAQTGAVAEKAGFLEGVAAIYPKAAEEIAIKMLRRGEASMQSFVRACEVQGLVKIVKANANDEAFFRSLNTPADLPW